jgi:predicted HicB family RNase H-like nuclease
MKDIKSYYKVHSISTPSDLNEQWYMVRESTSDIDKPIDDVKTITFKIDSYLHKELKVTMANRGQSIKEYIINLIKKDLDIQD